METKYEINKKVTVLFYGDSITDGNRYKLKEQEWDLNHQMGHSYAYIINALLGSNFPERNYQFKNKAISGNRIVDLYARVDQDVIAHQPDIISILVGVNDGPSECNLNVATDSSKFDRLYRMMLDEITQKLPDIRIVICEPFVCNAGKLTKDYLKWRTSIEEFQKKAIAIAKDYNAVYIPLQKAFDEVCNKYNNAEYWSWDGIHPTENGHGIIAAEWLNGTKELLESFNIGKKVSNE